jgi:hypothetical protein
MKTPPIEPVTRADVQIVREARAKYERWCDESIGIGQADTMMETLLRLAEQAIRITSTSSQPSDLADRLERVYSQLTPGVIDSADLDGMAFTVQEAIAALRQSPDTARVDEIRSAVIKECIAALDDENVAEAMDCNKVEKYRMHKATLALVKDAIRALANKEPT